MSACRLSGLDFQLILDLILNQLGAANVAGGADTDADDFFAFGIQTEGIVECRDREDLAKRNLQSYWPFP